MPLLWVMKGSYFGFGIPNNRLTWMQGQKTLSLSYYMHLFCLPYLLNDSFFGPLLCVTLICGDWSQFHFISPDKAAFVMWAKNSKMNLQSSFRPTEQWADNMLMFHVEVNTKGLGIRLTKDSLQWFRVDSFFWETITLYTLHFQI